ncbi:hypothetical protein CAEBREN_07689 [Caenorhabditis brenneri]|uniref:BTB domain-containing protein n=1 Tax=Caenorhabditis brenneri TaxID=135651 RepID=G0MVY5_CAEBE|nr:hypothetical protein CAEBREN_07689 [Caenorhabditis brenneri]
MTETPELSIYEKAFVKTDKTDAVLVVDGKKLHVNKALLSYHSDYFNTLFNSEFKEKSMKEIPIEDVNFENFATLLSLVQEKPLKINKGNAENLLDLSDRFLLNAAKYAVGNVIKFSPEFTRYEKLMLADKHKLEDLLEYALDLYNSKQTFEDFYSKNRNFTTENLLKLGDQFLLRASKLHVERFIISSTDFTRHRKLVLADKYKLEDLLEHAIGLYTYKAAYEDFCNSNNTDISDELKLKIFDRFFFGYADYYVEDLLKLADQFSLRAAKLQLENFIISSADFNRHQKLVLAEKYHLENPLEHAIGLYNTREAFRDFFGSQNTDISDELKLKLFNRFFYKFAYDL